jgi:hypothetical protein
VVAGSLSVALIRTSAPPAPLVGLKARAHFETTADLIAALARLDHLTPRRALLAVDYRPDTLTTDAVAAHRHFAARHPDWSTYVPLCAPGCDAMIQAVATPQDCAGCLFYEAGRCQGMGRAASDWGHGAGPPALQPVDRPVLDYRRADFAADTPIAYWMPTHAQIAAIAAQIDGPVWDVGGANGFFAALLAAEGLDVTIIDPVDAYPTPHPSTAHRTQRIVADVRDVTGPSPAAIFISWPPPGERFADVIATHAPAVVAYATDVEGFCGCQPGYAEVDAFTDRAEWRVHAQIGPGLVGPSREWRVRCHHDLRRGGAPLGRLQLWPPTPAASAHPQVAPYPWEREEH